MRRRTKGRFNVECTSQRNDLMLKFPSGSRHGTRLFFFGLSLIWFSFLIFALVPVFAAAAAVGLFSSGERPPCPQRRRPPFAIRLGCGFSSVAFHFFISVPVSPSVSVFVSYWSCLFLFFLFLFLLVEQSQWPLADGVTAEEVVER